MTPRYTAFIKEHMQDNTDRLLLNASRYPGIDIPFVVEQITLRRQIRDKLPSWYDNGALIFPARMATEQSSSEVTAHYKQHLVDDSDTLCDLTGGLGIDSFYFSRKVKQVVYMERFVTYCEAARHNFQVLNAKNIQVLEGDSAQLYPTVENITVFYIDPARRGEGNRRVFAISDCEPDLTVLRIGLLRHASKIIAKLSPMVDLQQTLTLLPETTEIHVLSVKNECKELLYVMDSSKEVADLPVYCVNFTAEGKEDRFIFNFTEEREANPRITSTLQSYLYEPNASILKAGAFKSVAVQYDLKKLSVHSHLYTSDVWVKDFPGRVFEVVGVHPFTNKLLKNFSKHIPKANITIRNFPIAVEELRKRTRIADGGDTYIFATTLADNQKVLIETHKLNMNSIQ